MNIPQDVLDYCSQQSTYKIIKREELVNYHTACGTTGNKPFNKETIEYLKALAYQHVVIEPDTEEPTAIINMAVRWKYPMYGISLAFSVLVGEGEGSLRPEFNFIDKWDAYESE